jgi:hypothetical protein
LVMMGRAAGVSGVLSGRRRMLMKRSYSLGWKKAQTTMGPAGCRGNYSWYSRDGDDELMSVTVFRRLKDPRRNATRRASSRLTSRQPKSTLKTIHIHRL